ncbi:MAG: DNA-processing protein DprA [Candidatus Brocadiia bacterium]
MSEKDSNTEINLTHLSRTDALWPTDVQECLKGDTPSVIYARGITEIISGRKMALFSSRQVPGMPISRTYDLMRGLQDASIRVTGGFHSPMERESLDILLRGEQPVIVCPARTIDPYQIPNKWQKAVNNGQMLLLSPFESKHRHQTRELARKRNEFVAALADLVVIAYAEPGGMTEDIARQALEWGKPTVTFDIDDNQNLAEMDVERMGVKEILAHTTDFQQTAERDMR